MNEPPDPIVPITITAARCPICGKPTAQPYRPFCSARCAQIDLGRWLNDSYRVETDEAAEDGGGEAGC